MYGLTPFKLPDVELVKVVENVFAEPEVGEADKPDGGVTVQAKVLPARLVAEKLSCVPEHC